MTERLAALVGVPADDRGGTFLLRPLDALLVLNAARDRGHLVLGVEVFRADGVRITPLLDWIADFSELNGRPNASQHSCVAAVAFVNRAMQELDGVELRFDLVLVQRHDAK